VIIDIHGHYTTAPAALGAWRDRQIAGIADPTKKPSVADLRISDDELRETIEANAFSLVMRVALVVILTRMSCARM
jgi:4-oxalmesaconate hydratase